MRLLLEVVVAGTGGSGLRWGRVGGSVASKETLQGVGQVHAVRSYGKRGRHGRVRLLGTALLDDDLALRDANVVAAANLVLSIDARHLKLAT